MESEQATAVDLDSARPRVVFVGPGERCRGGIASVISTYRHSKLWDTYDCRWLSTMDDRNGWTKVAAFLGALARSGPLLGRADIVHVHTASRTSFYRKSVFLALARLLGKKVVLQVHGGGFADFAAGQNRLGRWVMRRSLGASDAVLVLSETKARELREVLPAIEARIMPNPAPPVCASVEGQGKSAGTVLFAGWIEQRKGVFDLLEAFAVVAQSRPQARLVMAGKGRIAEAAARAAALGIADRVTFPGWLQGEALARVYAQAEVFCLPSYVEGVPMSVLEAMSYGTAVVASRVGGIPDVIEHGRSGLLVEPGNVAELVDTLVGLLGDGDQRERLASAARQTVEEHYTLAAVSARLDDLYQQLSGGAVRH